MSHAEDAMKRAGYTKFPAPGQKTPALDEPSELTCEQVRQELPAFLNRSGKASLEGVVARHLLTCVNCESHAAELRERP